MTTISFFGAIDVVWFAAPFAYLGTAIFAAAFLGVPAVLLWPAHGPAAGHAADAVAHHDHHEAAHSADMPSLGRTVLYAPLALALSVVDWATSDERRYRKWGK